MPNEPFPSPEAMQGLMGQKAPRWRCGQPCPQGGRCEVQGGRWQAKAGDSQGRGKSMRDRADEVDLWDTGWTTRSATTDTETLEQGESGAGSAEPTLQERKC